MPLVHLSPDGVAQLYEGTLAESQSLLLQVVDILRFTFSPSFEDVTGLDPGLATEGYDLVVSDGVHKTKCLLDPRFNFAVNSGELRVHDVVHVRETMLRYDERVLGSPSFVIVTDIALEKALPRQVLGDNVEELSFLPGASNEREIGMCPLTGCRGTYLGRYDTGAVPPGDLWDPQDLVVEDVEGAEGDPGAEGGEPLASIGDVLGRLEEADQGGYELSARDLGPLVGRITTKSALRWYGKETDSKYFPFQFYVTLEDSTQRVQVVFWARACAKYFASLNVGDVIRLDNWRYGRSFRWREAWEIKVNDRNPETSVVVLHPSLPAVRGNPFLGARAYDLFRLDALYHVPDQTRVDIAGIVVDLRRMERTFAQPAHAHTPHAHTQDADVLTSHEWRHQIAGAPGRSTLYVHRWVAIRDSADGAVFHVDLVNAAVHGTRDSAEIKRGDVLSLVGVRIVSVTSTSYGHRKVYGITDSQSVVYRNADVPSDALGQWADPLAALTRREKRAFFVTFAAGHVSPYPRLPTITDYCSAHPGAPVLPAASLHTLIRYLYQGQLYTCVFQARVVAVELVGTSITPNPDAETHHHAKRKRKRGKKSRSKKRRKKLHSGKQDVHSNDAHGSHGDATAAGGDDDDDDDDDDQLGTLADTGATMARIPTVYVPSQSLVLDSIVEEDAAEGGPMQVGTLSAPCLETWLDLPHWRLTLMDLNVSMLMHVVLPIALEYPGKSEDGADEDDEDEAEAEDDEADAGDALLRNVTEEMVCKGLSHVWFRVLGSRVKGIPKCRSIDDLEEVTAWLGEQFAGSRWNCVLECFRGRRPVGASPSVEVVPIAMYAQE